MFIFTHENTLFNKYRSSYYLSRTLSHNIMTLRTLAKVVATCLMAFNFERDNTASMTYFSNALKVMLVILLYIVTFILFEA